MIKQNGQNDIFYNSSYGKLSFQEMLAQLKSFLEEESESEYSLVIGSDSSEKVSSPKGKKSINLITTVVIHRKGFGGRYFWKRKTVQKIHTLRDKIYAETLESLNFATNFVPIFKKSLNGKCPKYQLELHVDVGEHGDTRDMIKEVVGMITGNGFIAKTKPESFGASFVADKHT